MIPYVLALIAIAIFALALVPRRRKKSDAGPLGLWIARDAIDDGATLTIPNRIAGGPALTGTGPTRPSKRPVEIFDAIGRIDEISSRATVREYPLSDAQRSALTVDREAFESAISRAPIAPTHVVIAPAWDDETPVGKVEVIR